MKFVSKKARELAMSVQQMMVVMKEVDETCAHLLENVSVRELHLISFVGDQGSVMMSAIAEFLDIPMSTATSVVDKMVDHRMLKRGISPSDRRKVLIQLDAQGQSAFDLFLKMRIEMSDRMLAMLTHREVDEFIRIIQKINEGLKQSVLT